MAKLNIFNNIVKDDQAGQIIPHASAHQPGGVDEIPTANFGTSAGTVAEGNHNHFDYYFHNLASNSSSGENWIIFRSGCRVIINNVKQGDFFEVSTAHRQSAGIDIMTAQSVIFSNGEPLSSSEITFDNRIENYTASNSRSLSIMWEAPADYNELYIVNGVWRPSITAITASGTGGSEKYTFIQVKHYPKR